MKKIFWTLFCLLELTLPVLGATIPGGPTSGVLSPSNRALLLPADAPQLAIRVTPGTCTSSNNLYTLTGTISLTNAVASSLTITDGSATTTLSVADGQTTADFSLAGLQAGTGTHTVTVSGPNSIPASTTTSTDPFAIIGVNPISCTTVSATQRRLSINPQYSGTDGSPITFSIVNELSATTDAGPYTLSLYIDNPTITLNARQGSVQSTFTYKWLEACNSGPGSPTGTTGYTAVSVSYTAPASCSPVSAPAGPPKLSLTVTPGTCNTTSNLYALSGTISLTNAVASSLTIADGLVKTTLSVTDGQTTASFSLAGLQAGTGTHTVTVNGPGYTPTSTTSTAPFAIAGVTTISCTTVSITQRRLSINPLYAGVDGSPITFAVVGEISPTTTVGPYTLTLYTDNPTATLNAQQGSVKSTFTYRWLEACNSGPSGSSAASATYSAPASCSSATAAAQLTLSVTPGTCNSTTNQYSLAGTINLTNAVASVLTITDGASSTTLSISAGQTTASLSLTGLPAGTNSRTVTVTGSGYTTNSVGYTAPAACSTTTGPPKLSLTVTPGTCNTTSNLYALSGTISLTNAVASSLTIADGLVKTTLSVTDGQTTASFSLAGLQAGTGTHTVTVNGPGYTPISTPTTGPFAIIGVNTISCTTITPTQRRLSINPLYAGVDGSPITFAVVNQTSPTTTAGPYTVNLFIDNPTVMLNAQQGNVQSNYTYRWLEACNSGSSGNSAASAMYSAPASCAETPRCTLVLNVSPGDCNPATNQYAVTGTVSAINATGSQTVTLSDGNASTTVTLSGSNPATFSLTGIAANGLGHTVTAVASACGNTSTTYVSPNSCSPISQVAITERVDKSIAAIGNTLAYTVAITNSSGSTINNIVVRDSMSTGLTYVANSAVPPAGTIFSKGPLTTSTWTITSLSPGQSLSLTFQARVDSSGILYNLATIPNVVATACTSIPIKVCTGDAYVFRLTAAPGRSNYKWFRNDVEIAGQTTNILNVTSPGSYRMSSDNSSGRCTESSCCPFIVEEEALPAFQATAVPATCSGNALQNNGRIILSGFNAGYTYQYSAGASFDPAAPLSGSAQSIPANGVIVGNLTNPASAQDYTVRVYNNSGCYTDATVRLLPTSCSSSQLALMVTPGTCNNATNLYTLTGTVSLTNAIAGSIIIADGPVSTTLSVATGQTTAGFSLTGLNSGTGAHTVTVSGSGYATTSVNYTAPASCSVCSLSFQTTTLPNGQIGTAYSQPLNNNGTAPVSYSITGGSLPAGLSLNTTTGVISGVPTTAATASFQVSIRDSKNCTAVANFAITTTGNPVCTLTATAVPGTCSQNTNTYTLTGTVSATNTSGAQSLTIAVGTVKTTITLTGNGPASYTLTGLLSDGLTKTLTVISNTCGNTSVNYSAPASCSVTPGAPLLALSVTPGTCNSATNQYTLSGTISLTNAIASSLTITDGAASTTLSVTAGQATASFSLTGLASGTGSHTLTVSGPGYAPTSTTAGAFAIAGVTTISCTTVSVTQRRLSINPQFSGLNGTAVTFSVVNQTSPTTSPGPYTVNLFTDNPTVLLSAQQGSVQSSYTYRWLEACTSGTATSGYPPTSTTYSAPASCSVTPGAPLLALSVTPGTCNSATNQYTLSGIISLTNAIASSLIVTDGSASATLPVTVGQATASFSLTGLASGTGSHTVIVSGAGYTSISITSPAHIAIIGVTMVSCMTISEGLRQVLFTPQYAGLSNEPVSFSVVNEMVPTTNPGPYSLKLYTDNQFITLSAQQGGSRDTYRYNWLEACNSAPSSPTGGVGYTPVAAIYQAPASCTVTPALALAVRPGECEPATNQYKLTGTISLTNAVASSLTITDGSVSTTLSVTAGQTTASFSLTGLPSGTGVRNVTVNGTGYGPTSMTSAGPFAIAGVTTISCTTAGATQRQVVFTPQYMGTNGNPISFSIINEISPTTTAGPYTLTLYTDNPTITLNAQQGNEQSTFLYKWLEACVTSHSGPPVYAPASVSYKSPASCASIPLLSLVVTPQSNVTGAPGAPKAAGAPNVTQDKFVDKSKAKVGDILTYTLVLTNSGTADMTNVTVRDSASTGLTYVPNSATPPPGTVFTPGSMTSTWAIALLAPGQSQSLTFQVRVDSTGILYNSATISGDTALVCTSVPVKVCPGTDYTIPLVAKQGRTSYRWFRNGMEIPGANSHILTVTAPGSYSLDPSGGTGKCPDFSCCPFIVEFDTLPSFRATTVPVTCTSGTPQANGKLVISEFNPAFTYQYSAGTQFNPAAPLSGGAQPIPANGMLAGTLANPASSQSYTIRVYNGTGCYRDVTALLAPTACDCSADVCVPFVIQKNKRAR